MIYIILIYLLTPWSRVLLEKLTVNFAASQEIPRIYGTRKFLTVPTSARHLSLSWANSIQSPRPPPSSWRSILILSSHLRLGLIYIIIYYIFNGWRTHTHTHTHIFHRFLCEETEAFVRMLTTKSEGCRPWGTYRWLLLRIGKPAYLDVAQRRI
jgi:hypothetical protein